MGGDDGRRRVATTSRGRRAAVDGQLAGGQQAVGEPAPGIGRWAGPGRAVAWAVSVEAASSGARDQAVAGGGRRRRGGGAAWAVGARDRAASGGGRWRLEVAAGSCRRQRETVRCDVGGRCRRQRHGSARTGS
ncbi:hypothetical protein GUJ93_ZPchr0012g21018 [Zizania palustris]|uniref:Uncharacterized protein n=1 Tax=Zizania palustris TaxID=103762 RepID=A0A8J5WTT4_ZIZPA|nr:hypothetical protein GUJ93_ZPchr0012g21018 [Zizania palustris]